MRRPRGALGPSAQRRAGALAVGLTLLLAATAAAQAPTPPSVPLTDLGAGTYNGLQGGLYPGGANAPPAAHLAAGVGFAGQVQPLDAAGSPDPDGRYIFLSIGMSNTSQEFCSASGTTCLPETFGGRAAAEPDVEHERQVILNGAIGGQPARTWESPEADNYRVVAKRLTDAGYTERQVQVVWLKQANQTQKQPVPTSLPDAAADAFALEGQLANIVRSLRIRYPNLRQVFVSSRTYGGYGDPTTKPAEPYAYEGGFAAKWLIEAQIAQMQTGLVDAQAGDLAYPGAPWIGWGPYLWANGTTPRSDGLVWLRSDFGGDGIHPSASGRAKVGQMLLDFFSTSPLTTRWFLTAAAQPPPAGPAPDPPGGAPSSSDPPAADPPAAGPGPLPSTTPLGTAGGQAGAGHAADTVAPGTRLGRRPGRRTRRRSVTFSFSSSEPGARFECRAARRRYAPCRSPRSLRRLRPGVHTFRVRAIDGAGNADPTPSLWRFRIL